MRYRRREPEVDAEQFTPGSIPRLCAYDTSGKLVVRTSDMSHETVRLRDYVVYPSKPLDEDGEPTYPEVWHREQFERVFEEVV